MACIRFPTAAVVCLSWLLHSAAARALDTQPWTSLVRRDPHPPPTGPSPEGSPFTIVWCGDPRSPATIRRAGGFRPRGEGYETRDQSFSMQHHVLNGLFEDYDEYTTAYVSVSPSRNYSEQYHLGWLYRIQATPTMLVYDNEEYLALGGFHWGQVIDFSELLPNNTRGEFIPNPEYRHEYDGLHTTNDQGILNEPYTPDPNQAQEAANRRNAAGARQNAQQMMARYGSHSGWNGGFPLEFQQYDEGSSFPANDWVDTVPPTCDDSGDSDGGFMSWLANRPDVEPDANTDGHSSEDDGGFMSWLANRPDVEPDANTDGHSSEDGHGSSDEGSEGATGFSLPLDTQLGTADYQLTYQQLLESVSRAPTIWYCAALLSIVWNGKVFHKRDVNSFSAKDKCQLNLLCKRAHQVAKTNTFQRDLMDRKGRRLAQILSVTIDNIDGERPGDLYGTITAHDPLGRYTLYNVERDNSQDTFAGDIVSFTDRSHTTLSASGNFEINLNLQDRDRDASPDDPVSVGKVEWVYGDPNNAFDTVYSKTIKGGNTGAATVKYVAIQHADQAIIQVSLPFLRGDHIYEVYGTITAESSLGKITLFNKQEGQAIRRHSGDNIVSEVSFALPTNEPLRIYANIFDSNSGYDLRDTVHGSIAQESTEFHFRRRNTTNRRRIEGQIEHVNVEVAWQ